MAARTPRENGAFPLCASSGLLYAHPADKTLGRAPSVGVKPGLRRLKA